MDEGFADDLRNAGSVEDFLSIVDQADEEQSDIDERLADTNMDAADGFKILAVTSCPTGIAHTYMAAEGIEKAAKAKNCFVKVETRGSGGAKNVLTDGEIRDADCIIVAADAQVPMERFDGKKVIECQVSHGISKADKLVEQAISGNVPVYHGIGEGASASSGSAKSGGVGHKIYTQLIKGIGDTAFGFMLPVLAGFIAMDIGDRPALAVGFVGGMIASGGKSGFLGALVAGFAAGYIILGLLKKKVD